MAILLEAGVGPAAAWRHVGDGAAAAGEVDTAQRALRMAAALARGERGGPALAAEGAATDGLGAAVSVAAGSAAWRQAGAAWQVAEESGSPLAPSLRSVARSLRALAEAQRDADVALAGPTATGRIVLALPAVGVLLGAFLGFDTIGVLLRPTGWLLLAVAAALVLTARAWNSRLVRSARPADAVPGLELELLAVALAGGGAWPAARDRVRAALDAHCPRQAGRQDATARVDEIAHLSETAGVPAAELLHSAATECRRDARARAAMATERLGVALMLPLGLCILPALVAVAVVPMVVALLSSTGLGF
ncbi:type II secretion system F family protein [Frondihabitans sp. PAMC 28766]|uniref:type II secretion system F family protein n=1 Tax=Frondihabitans sp. PAMC 28766 TaxID=1795630 RepID=UPI00194FDA4B|nr:type II secretion system F family protein [Frondihabitans sp. PAMC 28766]